MNSDNNNSRLNLIASEFSNEGKSRASRSRGKFWIESYPEEIELYKNMLVHRNNRILDNTTGGTNFLDIGCGFGDILYMMRHRYEVLYGIDPSLDMVQQCINNLKIR